MCLISKDKYPGIVLHEKEAYKIIICTPNCDYWEAPIMHTHHEYNKVLSTNEYNIGEFLQGFLRYRYKVDRGYFHAFTSFFYADYIRKQLIDNRNYDAHQLKIVKVRIPKGALYYEHSLRREICSNKIIVDRDLFNYL